MPEKEKKKIAQCLKNIRAGQEENKWLYYMLTLGTED